MKLELVSVFIFGAILLLSAAPVNLRRIPAKSARQLQATPYPAAGFRPKIPFELPGERRPKTFPSLPAVKPTITPTTFAPSCEEDEEFGAAATTESSQHTTTASDADEVNDDHNSKASPSSQDSDLGLHIPDRTYGPAFDGDDLVWTPSSNFEPPIYDAVVDFGATVEAAVADLPTEPTTPPPNPAEEDLSNDATVVELPADKYGVPRGPAGTYGEPREDFAAAAEGDGLAAIDDEVKVVEAANDTAENELASLAEGEVETISNFVDLENGRLIFVPADGSQLRQVFVAAMSNGKLRASVNRRLKERRSARLSRRPIRLHTLD